jgi:dTDP-4-amino-4,6-dideoxygalactose transaminase
MLVKKFEETIAEYFGSKYAVAVDCCTHSIELCLRLLKSNQVTCPSHTYLSIPMTFEKLNLDWKFREEQWEEYYYIGNTPIIDAAVLWKKNSYIANTFMCLSFQFKKHLNLGRGGMILLDDNLAYTELKKMRYDGRLDDIPWADQNVETLGYHYYMTPETAELGIKKFNEVKDLPPKFWSYNNYPNLKTMKVFASV